MLYCTDEKFATENNAADRELHENRVLLMAVLAHGKAGTLSHGSLAMDSPDSILVWNHYPGVKMKFKRLSGCLPDRFFNSFYSLRTVTSVTDVELGLL